MKITLRKEPAQPVIRVGGTPQVNLLPREVSEKREQRTLLLQWAVRVGAAAAVLALGTVAMLGWQGVVALQLGSAKADGMALIDQIGEKSEIQALLDTEGELAGFAETSLATELGWTTSVALLLQSFPSDTQLCGFNLVSGNAASGDPTEEVGLSGSIEVCGQFRSAAPFLANATSVAGIKQAVADSGEFDSSKNQFKHVINVEFDQTIYLQVQTKLAVVDELEAAAEDASELSEPAAESDPEPGPEPEAPVEEISESETEAGFAEVPVGMNETEATE